MTIQAKLLSALLFVYLVAYLIGAFYPSSAGRWVMLFAMAVVHVIAYGKMKKTNMYVSAVLTAAGAALLAGSGATAEDWVRALLNNAPIISLLLAVSLFTIPLHFERYHEVLCTNLPRLAKSPFRFYAITLGFTSALTSLLNVGGLPFVYNLLKDAAGKYPAGAVEKALIRGMSANMLWSPAFISVAIVMQYAGLAWFAILPGGAVLAVAVFAVALAFGAVEFAGGGREDGGRADDRLAVTMGRLFLQLAVLIVVIALLQYFTRKSALVTVPLVSFAGPLLLAFLFSRLDVYRARLREYFTATLPNAYGEMILFTAFGFCGYALGLTDVKSYIVPVIQYFGFTSPLTLIPLITFLTAFPCLFGLHPFLTISTLAIALPPGSVALTQFQMAGALMLGYVAYANLSPFSVINLVILGLTKGDPIAISLRQNWAYTVAVTLAGTAILVCLPL
jgi:hypothetical protein